MAIPVNEVIALQNIIPIPIILVRLKRSPNTPIKTEATEYENKIVKVIVRKKSSPKEFQKFIDKLYRSGVHDLKIVENFSIVENAEFDIEEDENTISILNRYIDESEIEFDKGIVKNIFRDLYRQACEVE